MEKFVSILRNVLFTIRKVWQRKPFAFSLIALIGLTTLIVLPQPSYAASSANELSPQDKIDRAYSYSEATGLREEARQQDYEQLAEDAKSATNIEKAYERNLKAERKANPKPDIIEKAEELVNSVTGK